MRWALFDRLREFADPTQRASTLHPQPIWSGQSSFGECPVWRAQFNDVCWIDIPTGTLRSYSCSSGAVKTWHVGASSAGVAAHHHENLLIIGHAGTLRTFVPETASLTVQATLPDHRLEERTNDLAFDASGALWVTTMHVGGTLPIGRLLRLNQDGSWMCALDGVPILNGPAFDPTRQIGYVCDSSHRRVLRFAMPSPHDTHCAPPEPFVTLTESEGYPDGITVDAHGNLWLAHYGGSRVTCFTPDGMVRQVVPMPVRNVTSVALGNGTLYITTARDASDPAHVSGGSLFALPLHHP